MRSLKLMAQSYYNGNGVLWTLSTLGPVAVDPISSIVMIIWCGPVHLTSNINLYHSIFPPTAFSPTCSYYILSQKLQNIGWRLPPGTTLKDSKTNIFALRKPSQYLDFAICICILKEPTLGPPLAWDHLSSHWFHWLPLFSLHLLHSALEYSICHMC